MMGDGFYTTTYDTLVHPLNELVLDADQKQAQSILVRIGDRRLILRIEGDVLRIHAAGSLSDTLVVKPQVANAVAIGTERLP